jgi:uncharacterized membrane protein YedE/YeeE
VIVLGQDTTDRPTSTGRWRYVVGLAIVGVIWYFPFVRHERVPLLGAFDLGIHELGHLLASPLGRTPTLLAGSVSQVLVPLALAAYFLFGRRDLLAGGVVLAWAGSSAWDVYRYILDAPYTALQLLGDAPATMHDWAQLLGGWGLVDQAHVIAKGVWYAGAVLIGIGGLACVTGMFWDDVARRREDARVRALEDRKKRLPVHRPRSVPSQAGKGTIAHAPEDASSKDALR